MLLFAFLLGQALGLPEVENPIPERIGLADVLAVAGAGGVLGGMAGACCFPKNKDRAVSVGGVIGLCFGAGFCVFCPSDSGSLRFMKAFVRDKEDDRWLFILIGVFATLIVFLANAVSELVYLPLLSLYLIQEVLSYFRQRAERSSKALLDADRSTGSR